MRIKDGVLKLFLLLIGVGITNINEIGVAV